MEVSNAAEPAVDYYPKTRCLRGVALMELAALRPVGFWIHEPLPSSAGTADQRGREDGGDDEKAVHEHDKNPT